MQAGRSHGARKRVPRLVNTGNYSKAGLPVAGLLSFAGGDRLHGIARKHVSAVAQSRYGAYNR
jgi:hypothetical protein